MKIETEEYMTIQRREEVKAEARKLRKQFLRYKEAEIVYSMQHKKLLELADKAGALYRIDGYVLINREIFDAYLERFHMPPQSVKTGHRYEIQRVKHVCRAASLKAGGVGMRYTCIIDGKESHLYYEDNNMWFVEGR